MNTSFPGRFLQLQGWLSCEEGQDLIEYALIAALLALGAVATMQSVLGRGHQHRVYNHQHRIRRRLLTRDQSAVRMSELNAFVRKYA
ncbi:MAG: hypothetical protein ABSC77_10785 [Terracidiphilus sp.]|jgi:hypothetical protein